MLGDEYSSRVYHDEFLVRYERGLLTILRVDGCVFCSISLSSVYMCVRMPSSPGSIAGVPSSRALPGYPITAHHPNAFLL